MIKKIAKAKFFNKYKTIKINNSNGAKRKKNSIISIGYLQKETYQKITKWSN